MSQSAFEGYVSRPSSKLRGVAISGLALGLVCAAAMAEDKVEMKPLRVGASLYFGQMFKVDKDLQELGNFNSTVTIPYTSLWMIQEATWNERFDFKLGIAGSFFYPFPEDNTKPWKSFRTGGVAIAQANGSYSLGEAEAPWLRLTAGQQGYKYNPYARNFGEYLFRSEAYPTTIRTGDWGAIDNAAAGIWGISAKTSLLNGMLTNDFLVTTANERVPLHDVSLTNVTTMNFGKVFSIGGGVMLSRLIEIDPEKSSPKDYKTGYFEWTAADQANLRKYINAKVAQDPGFLAANADFFGRTMMDSTNVVDTALEVGKTYWAASERPLVKFLTASPKLVDPAAQANGANVTNKIKYVDARTIFLMGKFSFDPKPLFGGAELLGPNDLIAYGELAVIGLKNYPIYYSSVDQRMPIMFGFNLPAFGFLDFLTVEAEILKNPHMNSDYVPATFRQPQPRSVKGTDGEVPDIADPYYDKAKATNKDAVDVNFTEDDMKWTLTALKSWGPMSAAFQYGTDHFRPLTDGFRPTFTEPGARKDARYYMIRLMVTF